MRTRGPDGWTARSRAKSPGDGTSPEKAARRSVAPRPSFGYSRLSSREVGMEDLAKREKESTAAEVIEVECKEQELAKAVEKAKPVSICSQNVTDD